MSTTIAVSTSSHGMTMPSAAQANPQMASLSPSSPDHSEKGKENIVIERKEKDSNINLQLSLQATMPSWDDLRGNPHLRVGIIINSYSTNDRHIPSIAKPATPCTLLSIVVLDSGGEEKAEKKEELIQKWLERHNLQTVASTISVGWGKEGLKELFASAVEAVYIIVPPGSQQEYVLEALQCGKHVLLNDPISTGLAEFVEQQKLAKKYGKFIQFSTMFVHQFQVLRFIKNVLGDEQFGKIHRMDATLHLSYRDVEKVGVKLPLRSVDGSIRVLGRFCVLVSTLFYSKVGSFAQSAKAETAQFGENGEITRAKFTVKFSDDRTLHADVGYTTSDTRQFIKLDASSRLATMNDFVIEHPDGLATYRVYEKASRSIGSDHVELTKGEAVDLAGGPPKNTMMWRTFVRLCHSLDQQGGWDQSERTEECRILANVALQTKRILIALMKSVENNFEEVVIDDIDYQ